MGYLPNFVTEQRQLRVYPEYSEADERVQRKLQGAHCKHSSCQVDSLEDSSIRRKQTNIKQIWKLILQ